jgi:glyoxylase-like metal-dependent hydrolase (beta-lactamase superfamily II)
MRDSWTVLATSALLAVFVAACGSETNVPAPDVPVEIEEAAAPLRLYVFDCGTLLVDDVGMFNLSEEEAGTHELFVPCYLVEHPQGRLLWELGLPLGVITGEYTLPGGSMTLERSLEDQLADIGVEKSDIDWVHFDHCGQINEFADRPQLMQRAEFEAAMEDPPTVPFYEPEIYSALADYELTLVEGDHDVFGDGGVVLRLTPGHTPGHQILFVDLQDTGPLVLSGDLYHYPANRSLQRPPTFNVDAETTLASMKATEAFLEKTGATLWIEHDAALAATLNKAPAFYE